MAGRKGTDGRNAESRSAEPPPSAACDVCGFPTIEVRCKIICRRCGYTRDCSDP